MSPYIRTQGERLVHIETLLLAIDARLANMETANKQVEVDLVADKAELDKLKNRGAGILIGIGLLAGSIGAGLTKAFPGLFAG